MTRTFKSATGSPVAVFPLHSGLPIPVPAVAPFYETSDPSEIVALEGSPEVVEVKAAVQHKAVTPPDLTRR